MKIALLTSIYSAVTEQLGNITEPGGFAIVDFSGNEALTDVCKSLHAIHVRFDSWEQMEKELFGYDLLVSYKLNKIIPINTVNHFTFGGVNIHPSMLPKYPGANPWFRMYYNMDFNAGVTIHMITEKPDRGNILVQQPFRIELGDPLPVVMKRADNIAAQLITDVIDNRLFLGSGTEQELIRDSSGTPIVLDSLKQMPVKRLWHILRGFPSLISIVYQLPHKYFEVGAYTRRVTTELKVGIIDQGEKGRWIACCDGIISLWDFSKIPMTQDYIDAVTAGNFADTKLREVLFKKKHDGSLLFVQGREAIVFPVELNGEKVAVRFLRNISLAQINEYIGHLEFILLHLHRHNITHFSEFEVLPQAIRLSKQTFPALIMKWYSGEKLMTYLRRNLHNDKILVSLLNQFLSICSINHQTGTVHGDIHSANIIVNKQGNMTFLDVDGIWISDFGPVKDNGGNRNWQHPIRTRNKYITNQVDNFSEIIVCSTIYVAMFAPDVFERYSNDDYLFHENDYITPKKSLLLSELSQISICKSINTLILKLSQAHSLNEIPAVETLKLFQI